MALDTKQINNTLRIKKTLSLMRNLVSSQDLVNWDAPILRQVGLMGDRYWEWVNLPVNRPIRFFQSDILELLSITPWYIMPIVWFPIVIYFFYMGCVGNISTSIGNSCVSCIYIICI